MFGMATKHIEIPGKHFQLAFLLEINDKISTIQF